MLLGYRRYFAVVSILLLATPLVVGFVVSATGSFALALGFIAVVAACGALSYIFLLGDVRRVEMEGD